MRSEREVSVSNLRVSHYYADHVGDHEERSAANNGKLHANDVSTGDDFDRPVMRDQRAVGYRGLSRNAGKVLYAIAVAELCGIGVGLSNRSIRKMLGNTVSTPRGGSPEHLVNSGRVGTLKWLDDLGVTFDTAKAQPSKNVVRDALQEIHQGYPFLVLAPGEYITMSNADFPQQIAPRSGGRLPHVHKFGHEVIVGWPCCAEILMTISATLDGATRTTIGDLKKSIEAEHRPHPARRNLYGLGFSEKEPHSIEEDIAYLVRLKYLTLSRKSSSNKVQGVPYSPDLKLSDELFIKRDDRSRWENHYLSLLRKHFNGVDEER